MKTLTRLIVPLLLGALAACGDKPTPGTGSVTVSPKSITVKAGESTAFTASVEGTQEPRILWSVEGEDSGTITSTGVYTAPTQAGTYTVVATNALDTTKKDTAEVTVTPVIHVTLTPTSATVLTGGSVTFTAEVTGATDTSVTWSIQEGDAGGTITSTGVYTAPAQGGTFTVVATSVADATKKAEARVTVSAIIVEVSPGTATSAPGGTTTFTATVKGHTTQAVSWSVEGEASGTITSTGVYTAPSRPGTFTVVATSVADPTKKGTATVTVPAAQAGGYTNPPDTRGWRLVKNTSASSGKHLVLDLLGPTGQSGRGVALTLSVDAARADWARVSSSDTEYVTNGLFSLGDAPRLLKGAAKDGTLRVGVFQKGTSGPATAYTGALVSVAVDVKLDPSLPAGTRIPLSVVKAQALTATGDLRDIDVAVGVLATE
ncbi:hypothetical protein F0U62_21880 [Cystobacter fuscus]|uniref:Ig-like domain-containing protein n=1 Tax=Cystobacter fuscus TaxID=43 RepID=UPI002B30669F|nr:hypothetical protein F0U62_21880 [Cystobacter fuscus]